MREYRNRPPRTEPKIGTLIVATFVILYFAAICIVMLGAHQQPLVTLLIMAFDLTAHIMLVITIALLAMYLVGKILRIH